jgi:hypothetical protein
MHHLDGAGAGPLKWSGMQLLACNTICRCPPALLWLELGAALPCASELNSICAGWLGGRGRWPQCWHVDQQA